MNLAPIILFVYNRPGHTQRTIDSLKMNSLAKESELYIYSDGPKHAGDEAGVKKVREYIKTVSGFKSIIVIERNRNLGLSRSVISGVSEIIGEYDKVIVLEDDLFVSPYFLDYLNTALHLYEKEEQVMHISGYMFPVKGILPETFLYRATACWGWATWKRAWEKFEPDANKLLSNFKDKQQIWKFNVDGSIDYYKMLKDQSTGRVNSWAIRWYASVFFNNGLCLHPGKSLVSNIGLDGSGIHCDSTNTYDVHLSKERIHLSAREIRESNEAIKLIADFFRSSKIPFMSRAINKLRRLLTNSELTCT